MLAAEIEFINPAQRSLQIVPGKSSGQYLITLFERKQAIVELQQLPFRRSQWTALQNGHTQAIYLTVSGQLGLHPDQDHLNLSLSIVKLPAFTVTPDLGYVSKSDFEAGLELADRLWRSEHSKEAS